MNVCTRAVSGFIKLSLGLLDVFNWLGVSRDVLQAAEDQLRDWWWHGDGVALLKKKIVFIDQSNKKTT